MNAFNTINLAGAVILTSTEYARDLGIPADRWIYALGGAGTKDSDDCKYSAYASTVLFAHASTSSLGAARVLVESFNISFVGRRFGSIRD